MSAVTPTIYIVDDDPAVLKSLGRLLHSVRLDFVAFNSPNEFLKCFDPAMPGCLVLDMAMPGLNGLELQAALVEKRCTLPIIFLTGHGDIPTSVRAMKRGALDFLTKPVNDEDLLKAVHAALEKDRDTRQARAELGDLQARLDSLTPREREVLVHVVSGQLNKQIAADLGTVEKTIKVHRAHVMEKMGIESLADLVRAAERLGLGNRPPSP